MKVKCAQTLLSLLVLLLAPSLYADVIMNNLNQGTQNYFGRMGDHSDSSDFLTGQEFSLPAGQTPCQLNQITLPLRVTGRGANLPRSFRRPVPATKQLKGLPRHRHN